MVREDSFTSRQTRLLFAYLVCERAHPVTREQIAEVLWPDAAPAAWDSALKSLVSRVRQFLGRLNMTPDPPFVSNQFGCYQLQFPTDTWIDLETARNEIEEGEGRLRGGDFRGAWGPANVTLAVAKRPFLSGEEGEWINSNRRELQELQARALRCYVEICLRTDQAALAVQMASQAVSLEPFRETGYQQLMRAHAAAGNRAEALQVYQRCGELLADELGVDPSPETEALYLDLLAK